MSVEDIVNDDIYIEGCFQKLQLGYYYKGKGDILKDPINQLILKKKIIMGT